MHKSLHYNITDFTVLNIAFGSTALRIATLVFLFTARYRSSASDSLNGVSRKIYGLDLVKEIRALENLDFKQKKAILDLNFLISNRRTIVLPTFLQFKDSNEQIRASKAYISYQKYCNPNVFILSLVNLTFFIAQSSLFTFFRTHFPGILHFSKCPVQGMLKMI